MDPRLPTLLREQHANGFRDVAGATAAVTLPMADRFVTRLAGASLPANGPLRQLDLHALAGNRFDVELRLARPAFLPAFTITAAIEQQPRLPDSPVVALRLSGGDGLLNLAGLAARFLNVLPPGVQLERDRMRIDVRVLLEQRGMGEILDYLEDLQITTDEGRFVLAFRARLHGARP